MFALGGFLELITDEELDDETRREFTEQMADQVARLTRLTGDLLDLSRLDAGELVLEREAVALPTVADVLVDEFRLIAAVTEHKLVVGTSDDVSGLGDEQRILRIGRSLIENALRHTPPGTNVEVAAVASPERALLLVRDDGPGVDPAEAERVFERFYRARGPAAHGSGLGLAIAREVAGLMEGELELSTADGWTTFVLRLALADEQPFSRENEPVPALDRS